jgi:hypothetical protein
MRTKNRSGADPAHQEFVFDTESLYAPFEWYRGWFDVAHAVCVHIYIFCIDLITTPGGSHPAIMINVNMGRYRLHGGSGFITNGPVTQMATNA